MASKDQDTIEIEVVVTNDERTDDANQLSLTVKLIPIVRLLTKQSARSLSSRERRSRYPYQGSNADAPHRHLRPLFLR